MKLSDFTNAIKDRLQAYATEHEIELLKEDAAELEHQIDKSLAEVGMMILINHPDWLNTELVRLVSNNDITSEILITEMPTVWRDGIAPVCEDVAIEVTKLLQGLPVEGFAPLRVSRGDHVTDKRLQIYVVEVTSKFIVQKTTQ